MTEVIETDRLQLRPLQMANTADIARMISEWEVIRWLSSPPFPYALSDAEEFVAGHGSVGGFGIEIGGEFAGVVGLNSENDLGYWLGLPFHGKGYMTEAAGSVVDRHFGQSDALLTSGYILGNSTSRKVLGKIGFANTGIKLEPSSPMKMDVEIQKMQLLKSDWQARHD